MAILLKKLAAAVNEYDRTQPDRDAPAGATMTEVSDTIGPTCKNDLSQRGHRTCLQECSRLDHSMPHGIKPVPSKRVEPMIATQTEIDQVVRTILKMMPKTMLDDVVQLEKDGKLGAVLEEAFSRAALNRQAVLYASELLRRELRPAIAGLVGAAFAADRYVGGSLGLPRCPEG